MNSPRRLRENIASLAALQLLSYAAPLLTVPYLVRVLGPAQFGLLSFAQGIVLYLDLITDYGFNFSSTRAIAAQRHMPEAVSRIFWSTICAKVILMLGSGLVLTSLVALTPKLRETPHLYAASFLYVVGTAFFPAWLFQGLERIKIAAFALCAARFLTVPALFVCVRHEEDYVAAAVIQASVQIVATMLVAPVLCRRTTIAWYRPSWAEITHTFRQGWPLFISGSALYLCTSSTTVTLGFVAGKAEVGYFSAADKLIKAAISLLSPVGQALYPHITAMKVESTSSALLLIRKGFVSIGLLSLSASVSIFSLAPLLCRVFLGPSFGSAVYVLQWLSPLPLLFGLMTVFGTQTMLVFEMDRIMSRIMLASATLGIPVSVALSSFFGARGAAAASVALATLIVLAMMASLRLRGLTVWRRYSPEVSPLVTS
jgi:O-antigen/teichoic acid export membrane protein